MENPQRQRTRKTYSFPNGSKSKVRYEDGVGGVTERQFPDEISALEDVEKHGIISPQDKKRLNELRHERDKKKKRDRGYER